MRLESFEKLLGDHLFETRVLFSRNLWLFFKFASRFGDRTRSSSLAYDAKLLGKVTRAFLAAVLAFDKKRAGLSGCVAAVIELGRKPIRRVFVINRAAKNTKEDELTDAQIADEEKWNALFVEYVGDHWLENEDGLRHGNANESPELNAKYYEMSAKRAPRDIPRGPF